MYQTTILSGRANATESGASFFVGGADDGALSLDTKMGVEYQR